MDRLVRVLATSDSVEGHLAKGRLEAEGIPVLIKGEGEGPYRTGPMYLWVAEEHEVQARVVLGEVLSGGFALPEGEDVPESWPGEEGS